MKALTFFNHAGGAAKSTTVRDVGYTLSKLGFRVLLIDCDPQANLSTWLGVSGVPLEHTIYPAVIQNAPLPEPQRAHDMDLIPSALSLAMVDAQLVGQIGGVKRLRRYLKTLDPHYDFCLLDSPPSLGQLSALAAIAADALVVPVPTVDKGIGGLPSVHAMVDAYREENEQLNVAFYLPTQYNPQTLHHREALDWLKDNLSPLGSPIAYRPAIYPDATAARQPVPVYAPGSPAAREIQRATTELLTALDMKVPSGAA